MPRLIHVEHTSAAPHTVGNTTITPHAQSVQVLIPGNYGGLVWNRPHSITVQQEGADEQTLPVPDPTRMVQWLLLASMLVSLIGTAIVTWRRNSHDTLIKAVRRHSRHAA